MSESELSFKSVCDNNNEVNHPQTDNFKSNVKHLVKSDSTQSEKVTLTLSAKATDEISEKDGYETCLDESLSDETSKISKEKTPTNSKAAAAQSEPCLSELPKTNHICLDTKLDHFMDERSGDSLTGDEFFLLQYSRDEVIKCCSNFDLTATTPTRYQRCIKEYYNNYGECLETYRMCAQCKAAEELPDYLIFGEIFLPFKSRSAPNILDRSFVTLTYDPGPENYVRRKSAFVSGYPEDADGDTMTVTRGNEVGSTTGSSKRAQVTEMLQKHWGSIKSVLINRDPDASLGISIVGGKVDLHSSDSSPETILGVFVKHVVPNSPAGRTGQLNTGDRILEVSGVDLRETNHEKAVEAIRNAPNPVTFLIQSLIPWIDHASTANVRRTKEEIAADPEEEDQFGYTMNKVKKKYASLGHTILMVQLERSGQGLGLSLAGHKDRNCMAVFVCGINPTGAAYRTGGIQVGDEILEVNGVVLHGRCHLNASAIIKGLSGPIFKVIILRRKTAIDDIAVRPITQFPVSLAEEASEEYICSYPNVRTVTARKGPQGLGIMIIEGKHTDVGQGIFISDIQEGSAAEKAGLEIGEMILAVNKEPLLGSNYENAASLLKRTEGLVALIVSNPTKKVSTPSHAVDENAAVLNDVGLGASATISTTLVLNITNTSSTAPAVKPAFKSSAPPSRPTTPVPEPPADPSTCPIHPGKETAIEINSDNKTLGLFFIGGKDTHIPEGIIVVEVYPGGAADKDGRLEAGDQILDVNGTSLKDASFMTTLQALRQTLPKMKLTVYRPEKFNCQTIDVDLMKKPGKGVGLSFIACKSGKGVYVSEVLNGGSADIDGKILKGDLLISVNGQSVENSPGEETGAILKTVVGRVTLKLHRYKPTNR